jgi:hypothetical protein
MSEIVGVKHLTLELKKPVGLVCVGNANVDDERRHAYYSLLHGYLFYRFRRGAPYGK